VERDEPLVVPDALLDDRFAENPMVTGLPRIRFYAGYPLRAADGACLGTVCVIDIRPREADALMLDVLRDIGELAAAELLRR
jgi:GAF domain-containing protein